MGEEDVGDEDVNVAKPDQPIAATAHPGGPLSGEARVPGDKSISHRALLLGLLAEGESLVSGLLEAEDTLRTVDAVRALGGRAIQKGPGEWSIHGGGLGALAEPEGVIDCGNAGTLARLLPGILAVNPIAATLTGDASLRSRPMERVFAPMRECGAEITCRDGGRLPGIIRGTAEPLPLDWTLDIPSAQVKSAILLAGLHIPGETRVRETPASRDHTERMLRRMGADIDSQPGADQEVVHSIRGDKDLAPLGMKIPGDISSAALVAAAALVVPGSEISLPGVGFNSLRSGFFEVVKEMGAKIDVVPLEEQGGERQATLHVRHGALRAVRVPAARVASMVDEYPALAVVASFAEGESVMEGLGELRRKESDRLGAVVEGLAACGVESRTEGDTLFVRGQGRPVAGGAKIRAFGDHRIAMSFLALGQGAESAVEVDDVRSVATSFPGYIDLMRTLGARIDEGAA